MHDEPGDIFIDKDGYPSSALADKDCKTCNGHGLLDDGWLMPTYVDCAWFLT